MTNFLAENFSGLVSSGINGKQMNARQWTFFVQSIGMHQAKSLLFFPKKTISAKGPDFDNIQVTQFKVQDNVFVVSSHTKNTLLGLPVFCDMLIEDPQNTTIKLNLANPIVSINQSRNITRTTVQGRNGTIKEYIADGDYEIDITAALFSYDGTYPLDDMELLAKLCKAPHELNVYSFLLDLFGVRSMVINDYAIAQTTMPDMQLFTLKALSDEPFEIKAI